MVTLPVTLGDPPKPPKILQLALLFISEHRPRYFKFDVQVDHSKYQPTDDKKGHKSTTGLTYSKRIGLGCSVIRKIIG